MRLVRSSSRENPHGSRFPLYRAAFLRTLRRLARVGTPIGTQMVLEFGAFGTTLLFMGWISVSALAGHQVAINLASLTYMFPLGVSTATSVRVGNGVQQAWEEEPEPGPKPPAFSSQRWPTTRLRLPLPKRPSTSPP